MVSLVCRGQPVGRALSALNPVSSATAQHGKLAILLSGMIERIVIFSQALTTDNAGLSRGFAPGLPEA